MREILRRRADPSGLMPRRDSRPTPTPPHYRSSMLSGARIRHCNVAEGLAGHSVCNRRPIIAEGRRRLLVPHRARASSPPGGGRQLTTQTQTQSSQVVWRPYCYGSAKFLIFAERPSKSRRSSTTMAALASSSNLLQF